MHIRVGYRIEIVTAQPTPAILLLDPHPMLELAKHIIETKKGEFDPSKFDDRYEAAVAELVKAKLAGKPVKVAKKAKAPKPVDLMEALRASVGGSEPKAPKRKPAKKAA
jgi:non-homologous end joining protein Ku